MIIEFNKKKYNLPQIAQYDSIPYSSGLCCPNCEGKGGYRWSQEMPKDRVVGYIINPQGEYEIVLECKHCFQKYRFHFAKKWKRVDDEIIFDVDSWKNEVGLHLLVYDHNYLLIENENGEV